MKKSLNKGSLEFAFLVFVIFGLLTVMTFVFFDIDIRTSIHDFFETMEEAEEEFHRIGVKYPILRHELVEPGKLGEDVGTGISDCEDLKNIDTGGDYHLTRNIYCSEVEDFESIGSTGSPFTGTFDGRGYEIGNLEGNFKGLFHKNKGEIRNIRLVNVSISSDEILGGLVTINEGEIENSSIDGGIITGDDVENDKTGGLVGTNTESGVIKNSFVNAYVLGDWTGGLVMQNKGTVKNSYARGRVFGHSKVGGLVGRNHENIDKTYASSVTIWGGEGDKNLGGLVGESFGGHASVKNSFWNVGIAHISPEDYEGKDHNKYGAPRSDSLMEQKKTYTDTRDPTLDNAWDFEEIWFI